MKAIIQAYSPEELERIARGEQTIKVCKTAPKDTPFKVYIYMTKKGKQRFTIRSGAKGLAVIKRKNGKVVGEYVCDKVIKTCGWRLRGNTGWCAKRTEAEEKFPTSACLTIDEIVEYAGGEVREVCGWRISDLKIYDEPKELGEFSHWKKYDWWDYGHHTNKPYWQLESLTHAPRGWQDVEELK